MRLRAEEGVVIDSIPLASGGHFVFVRVWRPILFLQARFSSSSYASTCMAEVLSERHDLCIISPFSTMSPVLRRICLLIILPIDMPYFFVGVIADGVGS